MSSQPHITLNDGSTIPQVGLGVWQTPNNEAATAVRAALETGYRHVDTAAIYENEEGVGEGLRTSGIDRKDIFLTTKLWNDRQGYDSALRALDESLKRLKTDYVDLYLIHWPSPHRNLYSEAWKALIEARNSGKVRAIGVSNFYPEHLQRIIDETGVIPVINQVELHPDFQQNELREFHARHGIATQSWSPLGQGKLLSHPVISSVAAKHGRTTAQIVIRWHIEKGLIVIPKSVNPSRIRENFKVFDFTLEADDLAKLDALDSADARIGPDPMKAAF